MRIMLDFRCDDGHTTEQFVNRDTRTSECEECGQPAQRLVSIPRIKLDPLSGDFPCETRRWAKKREKHLEMEKKAIANHGPDAAWDIARR